MTNEKSVVGAGTALADRAEFALLALNPENNNQARVFYCFYEAEKIGGSGHPQEVMKGLADTLGFKILDSVPQSLFDGWDFWIEFDSPPALPNFFRENLNWKPVGQA